jgi:hypothetical protein
VATRPVVAELQQFLWEANINNREPPVTHGWYTAEVAEMVRAYETKEDIGVDGRVTPPVWEHLKDDYCDGG